jgi:hypothetical protein
MRLQPTCFQYYHHANLALDRQADVFTTLP